MLMISSVVSQSHARIVSDVLGSVGLIDVLNTLDDRVFLNALKTNTITSSKRHPSIDPTMLAKKWGISIDAAKWTVQVMTQ